MKHSSLWMIFKKFLYSYGIPIFIEYSFLFTRFRARKTILGARLCMWEVIPLKEQTCTLLIITWYGGIKCTKFVLKFLIGKNALSISVLFTAPFLYIKLFQFMWWLPSMDQELALENSSSAAIINYLKSAKYLNIRLRQIY